MQFTNPLTGPINAIVTGGVVDSVLNDVNVDPLTSIATVTNSVPFPFRDAFFWPALTGEQFAPTLSGVSYAAQFARPCYQVNSTLGNSATGPNLPRIGFNNKSNLSLAAVGTFNSQIGPLGALANCFRLGFSNGTGTICFQFDRANVGAVQQQFEVRCVTPTGTSAIIAVVNGTDPHTYRIDVSAAGTVKFYIDNALLFTDPNANLWPDNSTQWIARWFAQCATTNSSLFYIAAPSISWT